MPPRRFARRITLLTLSKGAVMSARPSNLPAANLPIPLLYARVSFGIVIAG
jgi:hypothetical protein